MNHTKTIKVYLDNGNSYVASVKGSDEQIRDYFKNYVYVTEDDTTGKETKTKVTHIEFI